jgi:hypothetical protein
VIDKRKHSNYVLGIKTLIKKKLGGTSQVITIID